MNDAEVVSMIALRLYKMINEEVLVVVKQTNVVIEIREGQ